MASLSLWEKGQTISRCRSTPPTSRREFGPIPDDRVDFRTKLHVDPALLAPFSKVATLRVTASTVVIALDDQYILKLLVPGHDVYETVAIMSLASTVVPVPRVYQCGYSGNCAFILMEYVDGYSLNDFIKFKGENTSRLPSLLRVVDDMVRELACLDISHNDLYPRNIVVDEDLNILALVDWDLAGPWHSSQEYLRRARLGILTPAGYLNFEPWTHDWDFIFRKYCPDSMEWITSWADLPLPPRCSRRRQEPWTQFWRDGHWPGLLPWHAPIREVSPLERDIPGCYSDSCSVLRGLVKNRPIMTSTRMYRVAGW
ncbi:hypothetical protein CERSUDRAFT_121512 [Gelatoporia subvermispora B]|uniref:Protein kinase domain-containing protein n=1 Tax=Ceriporiopsis subvermispora (strain B) TaxID=914234 RepID=M2RQZ9_CERS8|nr:hypothetical protein CERSUDRAFT_121512 [Gelatoporia subvermispora B]